MPYKYNPLSKEQRKKKLENILGSKKIGEIKIPKLIGFDSSLPTYKIPLQALVYNPHNKRFATRAKTLEKMVGPLDIENGEHRKHVEGFLFHYKIDKNNSTIESLIDDGQIEPGIVTIEGLILSGNRRFRLINEIRENPEKYNYDGNNLEYFEAAIINQEISEKEINKLESFFQYGKDEKVDYSPIEKYLAIHNHYESGMSDEEIYKNFRSIAKSKNDIKKWREVFKLMEEYLAFIGEKGIYTALYKSDKPSGKSDLDSSKDSLEELFISLNNMIRALKNNKSVLSKSVGWDFDHDDIEDFKTAGFLLIRKYYPVQSFRNLREAFIEKNRWHDFYEHIKQAKQDISKNLKTFDEIGNEYPKHTGEEISKIRNKKYVELVAPSLDKAVNIMHTSKEQQEIKNKPSALMKRIISDLKDLKEILLKNKNKDSHSTLLKEILDKLDATKKDLWQFMKTRK